MTEKFIPLKALRDILTDARKDSKNVRDVNTALQRKMLAVNQPQYSREHVIKQVGTLREGARAEANGYLTQARTVEQLGSVRSQGDYWTLPLYLARAASVGDDNVARLLRANNFLLASQRMTTDTLATVAAAAREQQDWAMVGLTYSEAQYRLTQGDSTAVTITASLSERDIPEIADAKQLIAEARQLEEFTGYTLKAIGNGQEDLGVRMESYAQQAAERDAARAA